MLLLLAVLATPAAAEEIWTLQTGPDAVDSVPLKPVQPVDAWRCLYTEGTDGTDGIWLYITGSPNFFIPAAVEVRRVAGSPWTVAGFFPDVWPAARRTAWLDAWQDILTSLATLPQPGRPVFPSVLKLPVLTKR